MQSRYPRGSPLADDVAAGLLGLDGLRVGRHGGDGPAEFWVQSVWRARVLPAFDADAYLVAIAVAEPWQPSANPRPGLMERGRRLLRGQVGPQPPAVAWRRAVVSLQGEVAVANLSDDPVPVALRGFKLFEPFEYGSLDGVGYVVEFETWSVRGRLEFGNPEAPSHRRLEAALLEVARRVSVSPGGAAVADYLRVWSGYAR